MPTERRRGAPIDTSSASAVSRPASRSSTPALNQVGAGERLQMGEGRQLVRVAVLGEQVCVLVQRSPPTAPRLRGAIVPGEGLRWRSGRAARLLPLALAIGVAASRRPAAAATAIPTASPRSPGADRTRRRRSEAGHRKGQGRSEEGLQRSRRSHEGGRRTGPGRGDKGHRTGPEGGPEGHRKRARKKPNGPSRKPKSRRRGTATDSPWPGAPAALGRRRSRARGPARLGLLGDFCGQRLDHARVELRPRAAAQLAECVGDAQRRPVGALRGECGEGDCDCDDRAPGGIDSPASPSG